MKNKKAMILPILVLTVLLTMSGCCGFNYCVEIRENGGSVDHGYIVNREIRETAATVPDQVEEGMEDVAAVAPEVYEMDGEEYFRNSLLIDEADSLAALAERLNTLTLYETIARTETENITQEEIQAQIQILEAQGESPMYILRDVQIETGRMGSIVITGCIVDYQPEELENNELSAFICSLDLKFPGTVTEYTVGKKVNDTTLQINLNELWAAEDSDIAFTVRAKLPGADSRIVILLALCILAGAAGAVLYRRHRLSQQTREAAQTAPTGEEPQEKAVETAGEESQEKTEETAAEDAAQSGETG